MVWVYRKKAVPTRNIIGGSLGVLLIAYLISEYWVHFSLVWVQWGLCAVAVGYLIYLALSERQRTYFLIALFTLGSIGFLYSSNYVFDNVLEPHQQIRIKVVLGLEEDLTGAGYNVNQSKIAIGSGGLTGKGFLNGTQTKLKYVPEQDTDFIFCTVGEEQGFVGLGCRPDSFPYPDSPVDIFVRTTTLYFRAGLWILSCQYLPFPSVY